MQKEHIHFIGIGGIGMSALAQIAHAQGYTVSGCDIHTAQKTVTMLVAQGCTVENGHGKNACFDDSITIFVYSSDIKQPLPEMIEGQKKGVLLMHRSAFLAFLMSSKIGIAVSGSHGKTTTTGMISHIFYACNYDPTIVIGGISPSLQTNAHYGKGAHIIVEADESDRSHLALPAAIKVVTNIDLDHVDTYENIHDIRETFFNFLHLHKEQTIGHVVCSDDPLIKAMLPAIQVPYITYGFDKDADLYATELQTESFSSRFTVHHKKSNCSYVCTIQLPGIYNILNALAAVAAAYTAGIPFEEAIHALATFESIERRFTIRGRYQNALIVDDYAHHPEEIKSVIQTARSSTKGKLIVFMQPHRFTRVTGLWGQFVTTLNALEVDQLFITDIYGAGEKNSTGIHSKDLVNALTKNNCVYLPHDIELFKQHLPSLTLDDMIICLGAGDITHTAIRLAL